jgi:hypothetical protein
LIRRFNNRSHVEIRYGRREAVDGAACEKALSNNTNWPGRAGLGTGLLCRLSRLVLDHLPGRPVRVPARPGIAMAPSANITPIYSSMFHLQGLHFSSKRPLYLPERCRLSMPSSGGPSGCSDELPRVPDSHTVMAFVALYPRGHLDVIFKIRGRILSVLGSSHAANFRKQFRVQRRFRCRR